jgi:hypothetical protein
MSRICSELLNCLLLVIILNSNYVIQKYSLKIAVTRNRSKLGSLIHLWTQAHATCSTSILLGIKS